MGRGARRGRPPGDLTISAGEATMERLPLDLKIWPGVLLNPPFWEDTVSLPTASSDRPRLLMLREFERFYSDHVLPQRIGSVNAERRVVEERLVYADLISFQGRSPCDPELDAVIGARD